MRALACALVLVVGSVPAFALDMPLKKKAPVCYPVADVKNAAKTVAENMGGTYATYDKDDAAKLMAYINNVEPKTNLPGDLFIVIEAHGGALVMVSAKGCVDHARDMKLPARAWNAFVAKILPRPSDDNSI